MFTVAAVIFFVLLGALIAERCRAHERETGLPAPSRNTTAQISRDARQKASRATSLRRLRSPRAATSVGRSLSKGFGSRPKAGGLIRTGPAPLPTVSPDRRRVDQAAPVRLVPSLLTGPAIQA